MKDCRNIAFFVPHAGCPNCCVFCSQVKITGVKAEKDLETEIKELRDTLETAGKTDIESKIAFFGGSFTAIERPRMVSLLSVADEYIDKGYASGIRISTRPDCIDEEIIKILKEYRVTDVELGIQSTDDKVLAASGRGHTAADSFKAASLLVDNGFTFGGQMMIGLPLSNEENEVQTALDIVKMGAREARIYPTVVFENTKLYDMTKQGEYAPLTTEQAVSRAAACYEIFEKNKVKMLRVGLHASENLVSAPYGATHPAIGELVKGRLYANRIISLAGNCENKLLKVFIKKEDISMLCGNGKAEIKRIKDASKAASVELVGCERERFDPSLEIRSV